MNHDGNGSRFASARYPGSPLEGGITVAGQRRVLTGLPLEAQMLMQLWMQVALRAVSDHDRGCEVKSAALSARGEGRKTMVWAWRLLTPSGSAVPDVPVEGIGTADEFTSQSEAETWIGLNWRALLDAGVDAVELTDDGRTVYGPMGLAPGGD